jgi:hypothetical protein
MSDAGVEEFLKRVRDLRKQHIPSSEQIVAETFTRLGITQDKLRAEEVRIGFNAFLENVFRETLATLEAYELPVYSRRAVHELTQLRHEDLDAAHAKMQTSGGDPQAFAQAVEQLIEDWYIHFRQLFLSVSQSRKTRGGRDFELQLAHLLRLSEVPFKAQQKESRVDFMLPNYEHYAVDRSQCVLLSAKRTLRERWQQVVDELHKMNCPNVFLATTDAKISKSKVSDVGKRNIKIVVFDHVKQSLFPDDPMVVNYSHLANNVIPQWQAYW